MQIYRSALFEVLQTGNITGNVYENSCTKQIKIISDKGFYSSETFPALHEQNMNRPKWRNAVPYKRNNEPYSGSPLFRDGNTIGCQTGNRGNQVRVVNELCRGEAFILKIKKR